MPNLKRCKMSNKNKKDNFIRNTIVTGVMIITVICTAIEYKHYRLSGDIDRLNKMIIELRRTDK
jgi:hypothetical protein